MKSNKNAKLLHTSKFKIEGLKFHIEIKIENHRCVMLCTRNGIT